MSCEPEKHDLVGFHFGTVEGPVRDALEAHLLACRECLSEYLALKRAVELPEEAPAPSELSRARLKRAMADTLRRGNARWSWWERPLAVGLAVASLWLALGAVHTLSAHEGRAPFGAATSPRASAPPLSMDGEGLPLR